MATKKDQRLHAFISGDALTILGTLLTATTEGCLRRWVSFKRISETVNNDAVIAGEQHGAECEEGDCRFFGGWQRKLATT